MPLGTEVGLVPGHIVLHEDPVPKKGAHQPPPTFRPMYCGQTARWINIPLGMEVCQGHIVFDGDPSPSPERGTAAPTFRPMSIVVKWLYAPGYYLERR